MNADQAYKIILYAVGINSSQGYVSPDDFNTVLMPTAQRSFTDYLLGEYQQYSPQRPIPVVSFGGNERVRDSMAHLIYGAILNVNSTTGIAPFPNDYEYVDNMWSIYGHYNIRFIQQDRLDSFNRSSIDPVEENPIYLIQHEGFNFFPSRPYGQNQALMSYVITPPAIIWGYVLDSNGLPVYDPTTSQDPVWSDTDMLQVIVRALALVGVNLNYSTVSQYAQNIKTGGQ